MKTFPFLVLALLICGGYAYFSHTSATSEMLRCVDYQDHVVAGAFCQVPQQKVRIPGSIYPVARYRLYYGGFGSFDAGSRAWGGSDRALSEHVYRDASGQTSGQRDASVIPQATDPAPNFYMGAAHGGN